MLDNTLNLSFDKDEMVFKYNSGTVGPEPEHRRLDDIRPSLKNPNCDGPEIVYSIAMDVAREEDLPVLHDKMLLFGVVAYNNGSLGEEAIRSQGHVHKKSSHSNYSAPEVYEIWQGEAIIYIQESFDVNTTCYAVYAKKGDVVIVPPGKPHATISISKEEPMIFGAWCDREYGFEYEGVREKEGLAFFPVWKDGEIEWRQNPNYNEPKLICKSPEIYHELNIEENKSIYKQFTEDHDKFNFVIKPTHPESFWERFIP